MGKGGLALLVGIAVVAVSAPGAALASEAEGVQMQALMDADGNGRLLVNDPGGPWSWQACAPDLTGCTSFGRGMEIETRGARAGTVFRVEGNGATGVSPEWRGRLRQLAPPTVSGAIRANEFVSPLPGRWRGGWRDEDSEMQLSACETAKGERCTTLTEWHSQRRCPVSSSFGLDARFAGRYLRVADSRIGPGPHPRFAYAVGSPYNGKVWRRSRNTSVAVVGQIAPPTDPYPGDCGPPPPGRAFISKRGIAFVECRGECRAVLIARRGGRRARVSRVLPAQHALLASPRERLRIPPRRLSHLGQGRALYTVRVDGRRAAQRVVALTARRLSYASLCPLSSERGGCFGPNLAADFGGGIVPGRPPGGERTPVAVKLWGRVTTADGGHPPALRELTVDLDRDIALEARGLPICHPFRQYVRPPGPREGCGRAIVGGGQASFRIAPPGKPPTEASARLTAYNGGVRDGVTTLFFTGLLRAPTPAKVTVPVKISRSAQGRFALRAVAKVPIVEQGAGSLLGFRIKLKRLFTHRGVRKSYATARCSRGTLRAKVRGLFRNEAGTTGEAPATIIQGTLIRPCATTLG